MLVDLIEQHVRDCTACRKNPAFSCSGQSSRHLLELKVSALEAKVEQLKLKLRRVEREAAEEDEEVTSSLLSGVSRPKLLPNTEYVVASGLRLVDLGVVRPSLEKSSKYCFRLHPMIIDKKISGSAGSGIGSAVRSFHPQSRRGLSCGWATLPASVLCCF